MVLIFKAEICLDMKNFNKLLSRKKLIRNSKLNNKMSLFMPI